MLPELIKTGQIDRVQKILDADFDRIRRGLLSACASMWLANFDQVKEAKEFWDEGAKLTEQADPFSS